MRNIAQKSDFPILKSRARSKRLVYLDGAATSQKPRCVIEAEKRFYSETNANAKRGIYELAEKATSALEDSRAAAARFVGAGAEEISFARNATEALNTIAFGVCAALPRGSKILLTPQDHHSNLLPWREAAKENGHKIIYAELEADGTIDAEKYAALVAREKPRAAAFPLISNVLGVKNPAKKMAAALGKAGAISVLDATQAAGRVKMDLGKIGTDLAAFSGHKMYGPYGAGVLWGRKETLEKMRPRVFGGEMVETVSLGKAVYKGVPHKFEAGTVDAAAAYGLSEAVRYLERIGVKNIEAHEAELARLMWAGFAKIKGARVLGPGPEVPRHGIFSFTIPGIHPHDIASFLDLKGVAVRAGKMCAEPLLRYLGAGECARASFSVFTDEKDLAAFFAALGTCVKKLSPRK